MIELSTYCKINLEKLIATRMLINANSGGGKSWAIRRLLEQTNGKVQQIIIDLEGEFMTLREKFDYLLVGKEGEIQANIRTAEILARKILEIGVSTIIDLSELKQHERVIFVKRFLDSLIDSPKERWHPAMILIDEAHHFCPEGAKSESASSVIDLMARGRKRGFCGVLATQRISKLNKDAIAEANNCLLGRALLDIDQKRTADVLGIRDKDVILSFKDLEGEFYCFGPAFEHRGVEKHKIGSVITTHPDRTKGIILKSEIKTPESIKSILKDISNLQQEADTELKTVQDLNNEIRRLKSEIQVLTKNNNKQIVNTVPDTKAIQNAKNEVERFYLSKLKQLENQIKAYRKAISNVADMNTIYANNIVSYGNKLLEVKMPEINISIPTDGDRGFDSHKGESSLEKRSSRHPSGLSGSTPSVSGEQPTNLGLAERKIYALLCQYPDRELSYSQIGVFTGYSKNSGSFRKAVYKLNSLGLIEKNGENLKAKVMNPSNEFDFSIQAITNKLGKCENEIYDVLMEDPTREYIFEEIADKTQSRYSATSGSFRNAIYRLNALGIIQKRKEGIKINPELIDLE